MTSNYREDLRRAATTVLGHHPALACKLTINEASGTVSERVSGEVFAYVSPEFTAMSYAEWMGWRQWPRKIQVGHARP